ERTGRAQDQSRNPEISQRFLRGGTQGCRYTHERQSDGHAADLPGQATTSLSRDICRRARVRSLRAVSALPAHEWHYAAAKQGPAKVVLFFFPDTRAVKARVLFLEG